MGTCRWANARELMEIVKRVGRVRFPLILTRPNLCLSVPFAEARMLMGEGSPIPIDLRTNVRRHSAHSTDHHHHPPHYQPH